MANSVNVGTVGNGTTFTIPATTTNQIYISNGSTGSYNNGTTFTNSSGKEVMRIPSEKDPALEVTGKITWNGEDLHTRLERIESMLRIPTRDVIMEEKYKKLKELWEQYNKALAEYKTWERLRDS
jgi:hypothetical protein